MAYAAQSNDLSVSDGKFRGECCHRMAGFAYGGGRNVRCAFSDRGVAVVAVRTSGSDADVIKRSAGKS